MFCFAGGASWGSAAAKVPRSADSGFVAVFRLRAVEVIKKKPTEDAGTCVAKLLRLPSPGCSAEGRLAQC